MQKHLASLGWCVGLSVARATTAHAAEDIEYASEHLAEVPMDHRYAALPIWPRAGASRWGFTAQAGYSAASAGELEVAGPTLSFAAHRRLQHDWTLTGFAFADDLSFSGSNDHRPLEVTFADVPLALPADAVFSHLEGSSRDIGAGIGISHVVGSGFLSGWRWTAGALWQRLELSRYATPYEVLSGRSAGATGLLDYSVQYSYATPYGGISRDFSLGNWTLEPRFMIAVPLPRRGVQGQITGEGFDVSGNTSDFGHSNNYGDPAPILGMAVRYEPWGFEVDLGAALSEALLEPVLHPGIDRNIAVSIAWQF
jgi:hypothetical protein